MRIPRLDSLPDLAQRTEWARLLETNYSTLVRAEGRGDIKGQRPTGRTVMYSKQTILEWLGIGK
jgi:hypothetical protein